MTGYDDLLAGLRRADSARSLLAAWAQVCAARSRWAITRSQFAALKAVRAEREKAVTPLRLDTPSGRRCASVVDGEPCNGRMRLDIGPSDTPDSRIAIEQVWICDVCGSAEGVQLRMESLARIRADVAVVLGHERATAGDHSGCGDREPCQQTRTGMSWRKRSA